MLIAPVRCMINVLFITMALNWSRTPNHSVLLYRRAILKSKKANSRLPLMFIAMMANQGQNHPLSQNSKSFSKVKLAKKIWPTCHVTLKNMVPASGIMTASHLRHAKMLRLLAWTLEKFVFSIQTASNK